MTNLWYTTNNNTSFRHFIKIQRYPNFAINYKREMLWKMNPEQEENNDANSTYTSTSHCIAQIRHYIAKEKKYGEWEAIDCSRTLIGK